MIASSVNTGKLKLPTFAVSALFRIMAELEKSLASVLLISDETSVETCANFSKSSVFLPLFRLI